VVSHHVPLSFEEIDEEEDELVVDKSTSFHFCEKRMDLGSFPTQKEYIATNCDEFHVMTEDCVKSIFDIFILFLMMNGSYYYNRCCKIISPPARVDVFSGDGQYPLYGNCECVRIPHVICRSMEDEIYSKNDSKRMGDGAGIH